MYDIVINLFVFFVLLSTIFYFINKLAILKVYDTHKLNKLFYKPNEISGQLNKISKIKYDILIEAKKVSTNNWTDWPETNLYQNNGQWKIFPFYAFGIWVDSNCSQCSAIYNFLKSIKGLKLATLSKLSPHMKLTIHRGWGNHSNNVIRCHYGLIIPDNSYIAVSNDEHYNYKLQYHKQFEWLIFDDSKWHWAENQSESDRVVLIIDIERPNNIQKGTSDVGDTKELVELIEYFKKRNITSIQKVDIKVN